MADSLTVWACLMPINDRYAPIQLEAYDVWLGRGDECHPDSQYEDILISKLHCRVFLEQDLDSGEYLPWIYDNSSNGTFVNGELLGKGSQTVLRDGDYISLAVQSIKASDFTDDSVAYIFSDMRRNVAALNEYMQELPIPPSNEDKGSTIKKKKKKKKKRDGSAIATAAEPEVVVEEPPPPPPPAEEAEPYALEYDEDVPPPPTEPKATVTKKKKPKKSAESAPSALAPPSPPSTATNSKLQERLARRKAQGSSGIISLKDSSKKEPDEEPAGEESPAQQPAVVEETVVRETRAKPKVAKEKKEEPAPAPVPTPEAPASPSTDSKNPVVRSRLQEKMAARKGVASVASQFEEKKKEADDNKDKKKLLSASMNPETPAEFVSCLKIEPLPRILQDLRRYLQEDPDWLQKFVELDGLVVLIDNLVLKSRKFKKSNMDLSVEIECVKCIKVLLNDEFGLKAAFELGVNFFGPFMLSFESDNKRMRRKIPKVMASVAAYSVDGHNTIIEACNYFKRIKNERLRFQKIVKMLSTEEDLEFRTNILSFINALINFPPEVENRIAIREEFLRLNLKETIDTLKSEEDEALFTQVEQFIQEMEKDQKEVQMRGVDITNPTAVVDLLTSQLYGTPAFAHFSKIIQHFLLVRSTPEGRHKWASLSALIEREISGSELGVDLAELKNRVELTLDEELDDENYMKRELLDLKRKYDKVQLERLDEQRKVENERKSLLEQLTKLKDEVQALKGLPSLASLATEAPKEEETTEEAAPPPPVPGAPPPPPGKGAPPPPAPGMAKKKVKYQPSVQMKQLYWNKIQERKLEGTVWKSLDYEKVDLEVNEIEDLFSARKKKEKEKEKEKKEDDGPKILSFVDLKRANNVGIMLASWKMTDAAIRRAVLDFEEAALSAERASQFLRNLPTPEEEEILRNYQGDPSSLGRVEQFFQQIVSIPRLKSRLEIMLSRWTLADKIADISHHVESIALGCREIVSNTKLAKILEVILAVGNFMNYGPMKGATTGFRIEFMTKLRDVRTNDNKSTLLHFLASFLQSKYTEYLDFTKEISHVEPASKLSPKVIATDLNSLKTALDQIRAELKVVDGKDGLFEVMSPIYEELKGKVDSLTTDITVMSEWAKKATEWFGEDSNVPVEEILQTISTFAINLDVAVRDNEREKALAEKSKRMEERKAIEKIAREEAKAKREAERLAANEESSSKSTAAKRPARRGGVLDKVQNKLRTGTIYRGKKGQQMLEEDFDSHSDEEGDL